MNKALQTRSPIRIARLKLNEQFKDDDSIFLTCNGNLKTMLNHAQILLVESPIGFVELLQNNPSHRERISSIFAEYGIYSALMHHLIHPANDMWFRLIDSYHTHYTNDHDRPARLAMNFGSSEERQQNHILKHQMKCALERYPTSKKARGRVIFNAPSSPSNNPRNWTASVLQLPLFHKQVTSADDHIKKGDIGDWRRLMTDMWMTSWTSAYVMVEETQAALAAHYYRYKESLISEEPGPAGECQFRVIPPGQLARNPRVPQILSRISTSLAIKV